jgi:hypothetical protein
MAREPRGKGNRPAGRTHKSIPDFQSSEHRYFRPNVFSSLAVP